MWQIKMQMSPWAWLLIGLILGWLGEWLIDLWFWRRRVEQRTSRLQSELDTWRYRIHNYENATEKARADLESAQAANSELTRRLQASEMGLQTARQQVEAMRAEVETLRNSAASGGVLMPGELEEVRQALESARAEVTTLRQQAGDAGESQLALAAARRDLDTARADMARLRTELERLQSLRAELDQARAEARELADVRRQLELARERLAQAGAARTDAGMATDNVELEGLRAELQNATRAEMAVRADYKSARDALASLQVRFENAQNELLETKARAGEAEQLRSELTQLRRSVEAAERAGASARSEVAAAQQERARLAAAIRERDELEQKVRQANADAEAMRGRLARAEASQVSAGEELERLRRERDQFQERVNAAHLGEAQAKATASALEDARRQLGEQILRADNLEHSVATLKAALEASRGQSTGDDAAELRRALQDSQEELERLRAELAARPSTGGRRTSASRRDANGRDRLEVINGIGRVYERKLYDAGVTTFAGLARSTPEEIVRIIQPKDWQKIEPEKWIAEAGRLALEASGSD